MIFLWLDECVSHKIALAAETVGIPQGVQLDAPQLLGETGAKDVAWLEAFSKRGKATDLRIVFSSDGMMRHREAERAAAEGAGLIVFYAPSPQYWRGLRARGQAAYVIRWLDAMISVAKEASRGDQFQLPASFSARTTLKPLGSVMKSKPRKGRAPKPRPAAKPGSLL